MASLAPVQLLRVDMGGRDYWPEAPACALQPTSPAGADRRVCVPLPPPPEPPDGALRAQGPLPAAHPGPRAQGPSAVLRGRRLLPVLLPLGEWGGQGAGKGDCLTEQMPPGGGGRAVQRSQGPLACGLVSGVPGSKAGGKASPPPIPPNTPPGPAVWMARYHGQSQASVKTRTVKWEQPVGRDHPCLPQVGALQNERGDSDAGSLDHVCSLGE